MIVSCRACGVSLNQEDCNHNDAEQRVLIETYESEHYGPVKNYGGLFRGMIHIFI